jgi:hypothetical protein
MRGPGIQARASLQDKTSNTWSVRGQPSTLAARTAEKSEPPKPIKLDVDKIQTAWPGEIEQVPSTGRGRQGDRNKRPEVERANRITEFDGMGGLLLAAYYMLARCRRIPITLLVSG